MDLIQASLTLQIDSFYYDLKERCELSTPKFLELLAEIKALNNVVSESERGVKSLQVWELCFLIQSSFVCHLNPNDVFNVSGISNRKMASVGNLIFYVANFFGYAKSIDSTVFQIDNW